MRPLRTLRDAREGVTAIEFGILAPVLCLVLVGGFDVAHTLYMRSALQGIVQKTARDAALQESTSAKAQGDLDQKVEVQVKALASDAVMKTSRRYYRTFSDAAAARAEEFTDTNKNGTCDPPKGKTSGEPYIDANNNGHWDADGADDGQGGARDKTVYTVSATYPRLLPLQSFIPIADHVTVTATTVLANQPYADQNKYGAPTPRNCP